MPRTHSTNSTRVHSTVDACVDALRKAWRAETQSTLEDTARPPRPIADDVHNPVANAALKSPQTTSDEYKISPVQELVALVKGVQSSFSSVYSEFWTTEHSPLPTQVDVPAQVQREDESAEYGVQSIVAGAFSFIGGVAAGIASLFRGKKQAAVLVLPPSAEAAIEEIRTHLNDVQTSPIPANRASERTDLREKAARILRGIFGKDWPEYVFGEPPLSPIALIHEISNFAVGQGLIFNAEEIGSVAKILQEFRQNKTGKLFLAGHPEALPYLAVLLQSGEERYSPTRVELLVGLLEGYKDRSDVSDPNFYRQLLPGAHSLPDGLEWVRNIPEAELIQALQKRIFAINLKAYKNSYKYLGECMLFYVELHHKPLAQLIIDCVVTPKGADSYLADEWPHIPYRHLQVIHEKIVSLREVLSQTTENPLSNDQIYEVIHLTGRQVVLENLIDGRLELDTFQRELAAAIREFAIEPEIAAMHLKNSDLLLQRLARRGRALQDYKRKPSLANLIIWVDADLEMEGQDISPQHRHAKLFRLLSEDEIGLEMSLIYSEAPTNLFIAEDDRRLLKDFAILVELNRAINQFEEDQDYEALINRLSPRGRFKQEEIKDMIFNNGPGNFWGQFEESLLNAKRDSLIKARRRLSSLLLLLPENERSAFASRAAVRVTCKRINGFLRSFASRYQDHYVEEMNALLYRGDHETLYERLAWLLESSEKLSSNDVLFDYAAFRNMLARDLPEALRDHVLAIFPEQLTFAMDDFYDYLKMRKLYKLMEKSHDPEEIFSYCALMRVGNPKDTTALDAAKKDIVKAFADMDENTSTPKIIYRNAEDSTPLARDYYLEYIVPLILDARKQVSTPGSRYRDLAASSHQLVIARIAPKVIGPARR
ncbi:MAG: hypothetical protein H7A32_01085 [Deltaproteobacteria bacterium]|nr:hypothetical protein [Deltaproteobacteria bacterium]